MVIEEENLTLFKITFYEKLKKNLQHKSRIWSKNHLSSTPFPVSNVAVIVGELF